MGPAGAPGTGIRWYDANGIQVTDGELLNVFDDDGYLWGIGSDSASFTALGGFGALLYYAGTNCTGAMALDATQVHARVPSSTQEVGPLVGLSQNMVRPDDAAGIEFCYESELAGSGPCQNVSDCVTGAVLTADLIPVTKPEVWWTPPLHPAK